ncbi:hypothetical protein ACH41H_48110 [Streptomyces sp. NPDC020800]|uniref:hypothetical protein n=1 Tax=Streptomyces sp. NPDC020800 TaxID=3365092 RepID=UPI0037AA328C
MGMDSQVLECPAATVVGLVEWMLRESGLRATKLHCHGKDSDPLIVLAAAAAVKLGLPERLPPGVCACLRTLRSSRKWSGHGLGVEGGV